MYLIDGRKVRVVAELEDSFIVTTLCEDHEGYEAECQLIQVGEVYEEPPTQFLNETVAKLRNQRDELRTEIAQLISDIDTERRGRRDIDQTLEQYDKLRFLADYLEGKITHVVTDSYWRGIEALPMEKLIAEYNGGKAFKAITLFGTATKHGRRVRNTDLVWRINKYADGSGSDDRTVLSFHTSYEDALEAARAEIQKVLNPPNGDDPPEPTKKLAENMERLGMEVPKEMRAALRAKEEVLLQNKVEKARAALQEAEEHLRGFQEFEEA